MWDERIPQHYRNQIVTGDARVLAEAIPNESVDLIFTDPVYDREDDYRWLAETASRVLKPDGAALVWSNGHWHHQHAKWLEQGGLTYRWDFACIIGTGPAPMDGRVIAKTNRLIWMDLDRCSRMQGYLADGYISVTWSRLFGEWHWTKNPYFTAQAMQAFSGQETALFDPFTGGGTVPAVCKMLGRNCIAFEIDPDTAERARQRVANTQPIMTGFAEAEQGILIAKEA